MWLSGYFDTFKLLIAYIWYAIKWLSVGFSMVGFGIVIIVSPSWFGNQWWMLPIVICLLLGYATLCIHFLKTHPHFLKDERIDG
jgi:hypothetical protein